MLQSTLLDVKRIVTQLDIINDEQIETLLELFNLYKSDMFIYPGAIINKVNINANIAYAILTELVSNGILELNFQYYCFDCKGFSDKLYENFNLVTNLFECDLCDIELTKDKNLVAVYKVIK